MPIEIINPIPAEILSGGTSGANYVLNTDSYDVALGGQPFLLGTSNDRPYIREVQDIKKAMFDNFAEPGEYSMQEWWLRSQSDWSGGQGVLYQDPSVDLRFNIKYNLSRGINVWNPGEISLLPKAMATQRTQITESSRPSLTRGWFIGGSTPAVWFTVEEKLYSINLETNNVTNVDYSGADPESQIVSLASVGTTYFVATINGIYSGSEVSPGAKIWNATGGQDIVIEWVKGRLMAGMGNAVYELVGTGPALPTAKFTHLDFDWVWTSIAEGPTSIYFAGGNYPDSSIYKFVLETDGAVPTLTSGGTVASPMPPGEMVSSIYCYLGTFFGIASNKGFRVGQIDTQGDIAYGPLLWEKASHGILGDDRFFYVGVTGGIDLDPDLPDTPASTFIDAPVYDEFICDGIYRVDLGQELQSSEGSSLRYAYSTDRYLNVPVVAADPTEGNQVLQGITMVGDRFIFGIYRNYGVDNDDGWTALWPTDREQEEKYFATRVADQDHYTRLEDGYMQTGRVGFNTLEAKMYRFFSVRAPAPLEGNISVDLLDENAVPTRYITYTPSSPPDVGDIPLSTVNTPKPYVSLRFTLHRNETDDGKGAVMNGWQLKALPAPIRQRMFMFSVLCFDFEKDKTGQSIGGEGYALERIQTMEQMAQAGNAVLLQDLYNEIGTQVVIDQMQFMQMAPPGPNVSGWGGYITFRLRTVADVIG